MIAHISERAMVGDEILDLVWAILGEVEGMSSVCIWRICLASKTSILTMMVVASSMFNEGNGSIIAEFATDHEAIT